MRASGAIPTDPSAPKWRAYVLVLLDTQGPSTCDSRHLAERSSIPDRPNQPRTNRLRCRRTEACESRFHRPRPYTGASGSMNLRFRIRLGTWSRNQIRKDSRQRRMSDAPFDTQDQRFAETGASKNAAIICLSIETSGVSRQRQALPEADSRSSRRTSLIARFSRRASRQN
jgi:hypothetical protein